MYRLNLIAYRLNCMKRIDREYTDRDIFTFEYIMVTKPNEIELDPDSYGLKPIPDNCTAAGKEAPGRITTFLGESMSRARICWLLDSEV